MQLQISLYVPYNNFGIHARPGKPVLRMHLPVIDRRI